MALIIHGASGPVNPATPGNFGANAFFNLQECARQNPQAANQATVNYTPAQNPQMKDSFAFSEGDIQSRDANQDGKLTAQELGGDPEAADRFVKVVGSNGVEIDPVDATAHLLFQDDAMNQMFRGIGAFLSQGLLPPKQAAEMMSVLMAASQGATSQADGHVTAQERNFANFCIQNMPFLTKQILSQFPQALGLRERYQEYWRQTRH